MRKYLILVVLFACSPSKEEQLIQQSLEIHGVAMKTGKEAREKIKQIEAVVETLQDSVKVSYRESLQILNEDYAAWEAGIVEVPGHEHDHHHHDHSGHDHDHDHDHAPSPDLTPEMVLEIQTEMRDQAIALNKRSEELLKTLKELEK